MVAGAFTFVKNWPPLLILYIETPTLSVEAVQLRLIAVWDTAVAVRLVGTDGGVVSDEPNVAVTVVFAVSETVHVPVPEQPPPDQPVNDEPALAAAVSVTDVPEFRAEDVQVEPQLIPPVLLVTVPVPVPLLVTERVKVVGVPPACVVALTPAVGDEVLLAASKAETV